MGTQKMVLWIVVVLVVVGAGYILVAQERGGDQMMKDEAMTGETKKDDAMMEENKMENDGASMDKKDDAMMEGDTMMEKGSYEPYAPEKLALAESGTVVLYFHADWCPICRGIEGEIKANPAGIPSGVTILKVDYDTATDLKRKYGVTYQHTFVQVDSNGNQVTKWGDATTLAQAIAKIK